MAPTSQSLPTRPTTVWLARHGEVHNPRQWLYGRLPRVRLSAEGQRQAHALGRFLAERPFQAIYSSPMLRARATARAVQAFHPELRVRVAADLHEVRTAWEGHPLAALQGIDWDFYGNQRHPQDESMADVRDRMRRWLARVLARHAGGEVVGVTHGDPILILVADLRGLPMDLGLVRPAVYIPTASVFRLTFDSQGAFSEATMFVPYEQAAA